jgi:hypothetical protein
MEAFAHPIEPPGKAEPRDLSIKILLEPSGERMPPRPF